MLPITVCWWKHCIDWQYTNSYETELPGAGRKSGSTPHSSSRKNCPSSWITFHHLVLFLMLFSNYVVHYLAAHGIPVIVYCLYFCTTMHFLSIICFVIIFSVLCSAVALSLQSTEVECTILDVVLWNFVDETVSSDNVCINFAHHWSWDWGQLPRVIRV